MSTLYVMVGIPGSGKSTVAHNLENVLFKSQVISSDDVRAELYGDASDQTNPAKVFKVVNDRTSWALAHDYDVLYDATSLTPKIRKNILKEFPNARPVCIYLDTPLDVCLQRNSNRDRVVPEEVIRRMHSRMVEPTKEEGFDEIVKISS